MKKAQTINEAFELQSKKRTKRKKTVRQALVWLKFILTLGLTITIVVFVALSPLFDVRTIVVNGAHHYKSDDIRDISGITAGENGFKLVGSSPLNIFTLRIGSAEKLLKQRCPYIKDIKVKFLPASRVIINLEERSAFAAVPSLGTSLLLDWEGYVLETLPGDAKTGLPMIEGLKFKPVKPGAKLSIENMDSLKNAFGILGVVTELDGKDDIKLYKSIDSVDVGDPGNVKLLLDSRVTVDLGDLADLYYKISETKTVYYKSLGKDAKGVLDFTAGADPIFKPESGG